VEDKDITAACWNSQEVRRGVESAGRGKGKTRRMGGKAKTGTSGKKQLKISPAASKEEPSTRGTRISLHEEHFSMKRTETVAAKHAMTSASGMKKYGQEPLSTRCCKENRVQDACRATGGGM